MKKILFLVSAALFLVPSAGMAHLEGQAKVDNNYRVELGQFPQAEVKTDENVAFSLAMENVEGERVMDMSAWIRLSLDDAVIFSSTDFITDNGTLDFDYRFTQSGVYDMTIRVINLDNDDEANVIFPLEVSGPLAGEDGAGDDRMATASRRNLALFTLILGAIGGGLLGHIFTKNGGNKEKTSRDKD